MKIQRALMSGVFSLIFCSSSYAAEAPNCKADIAKFCKGVKARGGKIKKCLKVHELELSQSCRQKETTIKAQREQVKTICRADIEKLCKGNPRIGRCLKKNETNLSTACKAARQKK